MKTKLLNYDVADHLRNADEMSAYLEAIVVEFDGEACAIARAKEDIARAKLQQEQQYWPEQKIEV